MKLIVNDKPHQHAGSGTIPELLAELSAIPARTALIVNDEVAPRAAWDETRLHEGDRVEVLIFAGGG